MKTNLKCPRCGGEHIEQVMGDIYQCQSCYRVILLQEGEHGTGKTMD